MKTLRLLPPTKNVIASPGILAGLLLATTVMSGQLAAQGFSGTWPQPANTPQPAGEEARSPSAWPSVSGLYTPNAVSWQDKEPPAAQQTEQPAPTWTPVDDEPPCATGGNWFGDSCTNDVYRMYRGVDQFSCKGPDGEPTWRNAQMIPWEAFAYGEYIGPHRTPHVPCYRVRVNDRIEFVYQLTREQTPEPYRLMVGDIIEVSSTADEELNQTEVRILSDGSISLRLIGRVMAARKTIEELQNELNRRYDEFFETDPAIVVRGTTTDTRTQDLIDAVDARFGSGGQGREATVSPDGTVQLPMIGSVPVVGLTLDELKREVNMRYRQRIQGFEITPVLVQRAPRFIYVVGEVGQPGRVELTGPTSAMQAVALAGGWNSGGNLRQIVVLRRDENWRLMALRLDLAGGLNGQRPYPSDEIWLRDSDIVLVPKQPIQRIAEVVDLYFTRTLYGIIPSQFAFDNGTIF